MTDTEKNRDILKMSEKKKILIFPAGTEIAFEIREALQYSKFVELYGATGADCHAEFVFSRCFSGLPYADDPELIPALNQLIDEYGIDYIYPAHDSALLTLTRFRDKLHCAVVTSPLETVEVCRDKNKTYEFFRGADYLPRTYSCVEQVETYPVFIKPAVGQGSEGARLIQDKRHLEEALSDVRSYAICEYLPGSEFTVDCFTDLHGNLRFVNPRSRDRIRAGIAVRSQNLASDATISSIAEDINSRLRFNGAWFFQLKKNSAGEYRLLEIAPRIAGTMALSRSLGINMPLLTLYNMWGSEVELLSNGNDVLLDRAFISRFKTSIEYDCVYVDFDDTLILNGEVNSLLMMFLYQARNKGKKLFLLTRHSTDIYSDLQKSGISESLFEEIIWLKNGEKKSAFVKRNSILIDDSFAERKNVRDVCDVPVFDLDMIESLLDWRS